MVAERPNDTYEGTRDNGSETVRSSSSSLFSPCSRLQNSVSLLILDKDIGRLCLRANSFFLVKAISNLLDCGISRSSALPCISCCRRLCSKITISLAPLLRHLTSWFSQNSRTRYILLISGSSMTSSRLTTFGCTAFFSIATSFLTLSSGFDLSLPRRRFFE